MHAIVTHANIHDPAEAKRGLDEDVIPLMKDAPGFVGATSSLLTTVGASPLRCLKPRNKRRRLLRLWTQRRPESRWTGSSSAKSSAQFEVGRLHTEDWMI